SLRERENNAEGAEAAEGAEGGAGSRVTRGVPTRSIEPRRAVTNDRCPSSGNEPKISASSAPSALPLSVRLSRGQHRGGASRRSEGRGGAWRARLPCSSGPRRARRAGP